MCSIKSLSFDGDRLTCTECGWSVATNEHQLAPLLGTTACLHVTDWPSDPRGQYRVFERLMAGRTA